MYLFSKIFIFKYFRDICMVVYFYIFKLDQHATTFNFVDMHHTCSCVGLDFIYVNNKVSYVKKKMLHADMIKFLS